MSLYIAGKKYNVTVAKWRGFWSVTIHGLEGTVVDCGTQKTIGEKGYVSFKFAEAGVFTFIAMRGDKTLIQEVTLEEGNYFIDIDMYVGMRYLQYIESTGTQYIDTGIIPSEVDKISIKFKNTNNNMGYLIGAAGGGKYNYIGIHNVFGGYGENWGSATDWTKFNISTDTVNIHTIEIDLTSKPKFYFDNVLKATQDTYSTISSTYTLKINDSVYGSSNRCSAQYYDVEFFKDNVLIRHFVPTKYEEEIGMYDTVTKQFYPNAGTGEFIAGPEKE